MNNPIYIKLTYLTKGICIIKLEDIYNIQHTEDKTATEVCTKDYTYTVSETPDEIATALKNADIQVIECGNSVEESAAAEPAIYYKKHKTAEVAPTEEPKKWFRVISDYHAVFKKGEKVYLLKDDGSNCKIYSNGLYECVVRDNRVEPWTDNKE